VDEDGVIVVWSNPEQLLMTALDLDGKEMWQRDLARISHGYFDFLSFEFRLRSLLLIKDAFRSHRSNILANRPSFDTVFGQFCGT